MKKHTIILFALGLFLSSCQDSFEKWGTVTYYPSFLWVDADTLPLTKTFEFEFSNDAVHDGNVSAKIAFVDNNGKIIPTSEMIVYMDGEKLSNNTFTINSRDTEKEFQFLFTPQAKSGKHQGRMKVVSSNLHRIDNLNYPEDGNLFHQWTIYFDVQMNPLMLRFIICVLCACLIAVVYWTVALCVAIKAPKFPIKLKFRFKHLSREDSTIHMEPIASNDKNIIVEEVIRTSALSNEFIQKLVIASHESKITCIQSPWNKRFKGKIKYIQVKFYYEKVGGKCEASIDRIEFIPRTESVLVKIYEHSKERPTEKLFSTKQGDHTQEYIAVECNNKFEGYFA